MEMGAELYKEIRLLFEGGKNVSEELGKRGIGISFEIIEAIYDLQAGSYSTYASSHPAELEAYTSEIASVLNEYSTSSNSILDCGTGEATSLIPIIEKVAHLTNVIAIDSSWSRLRWASKNLRASNVSEYRLAVADIAKIPLPDNSVDIVLTVHALEPNGGAELEMLTELNRVARKYLILVEPDFMNAPRIQQKRMKTLGYIGALLQPLSLLGLAPIEVRPILNNSNVNNRASIFVIPMDRRNLDLAPQDPATWIDPIMGEELTPFGSGLGTSKGLWFPTLMGIPFLRSSDAKIVNSNQIF